MTPDVAPIGGTAVAGTTATSGALASSPSAGDFLICWLAVGDNSTTVTTPTGYTLLGSLTRAGSMTLAVFWKVATGSEGTTQAISWGSSASAVVGYVRIPGAAATFEATSTPSIGTALTCSNTGSVTLNNNELVMCIVGTLGKPTHSVPLDSLAIDAQGVSTSGSGTTGASTSFSHKQIVANETPTVGVTLSASRNFAVVELTLGPAAALITPAVINATSTMGGALVSPKRAISGAVAATSSMGGSLVSPIRALGSGAVAATSTVAATISGTRTLGTAAIAATSTLAALLYRQRPLGSGAVAATSTLAGAITALRGIAGFWFPGPASSWPTSYLNKDKFGLRDRSLRIADYPAPAGFSYDSGGYLKKIGSKAAPVTITFNRSGIALTGCVLADFPGFGTADSVIGGTPTTEFFLRNVEIVGQINPTGANIPLTVPFTPGDTQLHVTSTTYPTSGVVRIGQPGGLAATLVDGTTKITWLAHTPGAAGNSIRVALVVGSPFGYTAVGSDYTITCPNGSTAGNVVDWINGQTGIGGIAHIFYATAAPRTTVVVSRPMTALAGGVDPGYEELIFTSKATGVLNLDPTSSANASRSYGIGSHVVWDVPVHISNVKRTNPVVDGFDDSFRASVRGDQDLNALTGIGAGQAQSALGGSNRDILWKTWPGSTNGASKVSVTYVKALPAGTAGLLVRTVSFQSQYLVHTNVGDGGFEKSVIYTAAGTNPATVASASGDLITVTLRSNAGVSLATAEEVRAACMAAVSATIGTYYKPGTAGTEIVQPMSQTFLINGRVVVVLATTTGTITSTAQNVIDGVNATPRAVDFLSGSLVAGSAVVTELSELILSTGASGGTLLVNDINGDLAAGRFPVASPSVPLQAYSGTLGSFQYEGYSVSGGNPRFTGVSPLVQNNPPTGLSQTVLDGEEIRPLFPYASLWPQENVGLNCTNAHLRLTDFWNRYGTSEPSQNFNSDQASGVRSSVQYFFNECFVQDGTKWGAAGGNIGINIQNGTALLHPAAPLGHHAPVHTDNFQVNYCDQVTLSYIYIPNAHNSALFSNIPGANDYPGAITRDFVWDHCIIRCARQGLTPPPFGFNFSGGYVAEAPATTRTGTKFCWYDHDSFGSTHPINFANNVDSPVNVENRWIQDSTLIPGSTSLGTITGLILATSVVSAPVAAFRAVTGAVAATSSMGGSVAASRAVSGAVAATSSMGGNVTATRSLSVSIIAATSIVAGNVRRTFPIGALNISATSTVSAGVGVLRGIDSNSIIDIVAQSTVTGTVGILRPLTFGAITCISMMTGTVFTTHPIIQIVPSQIAAMSTLSGDLKFTRSFGGQIAATSTVTGSAFPLRRIPTDVINATSTVAAGLSYVRHFTGLGVSATSMLTGSVVKTFVVGGAINATSTMNGDFANIRLIQPEDTIIFSTVTFTGDIDMIWAINTDIIRATSTLMGALTKEKFSHIMATSTVAGRVRKILPYFPPYSNPIDAFIRRLSIDASIRRDQ